MLGHRREGSFYLANASADSYLLLLLVPVLVVLIVLVRMGVSDSFVGMFVGVLALRTGLPIMCVLVVTVAVRLLVGMSYPVVGVRVIRHLDLLVTLIRSSVWRICSSLASGRFVKINDHLNDAEAEKASGQTHSKICQAFPDPDVRLLSPNTVN